MAAPLTADARTARRIARQYAQDELGWPKATVTGHLEGNQGWDEFLVRLETHEPRARVVVLLVQNTGRSWEVVNETDQSDYDANAAEVVRCAYCDRKTTRGVTRLGCCPACANAGIET